MIASIALALAAAAQEPRLGSVAGKDDMAAIFTKIAGCMVDSHPRVVRKWLDYLPGSEAEDHFVMTQEGPLSICMESGSVETHTRLEYKTDELRPFIAAAAARAATAKAPEAIEFDTATKPWFSQQLSTMQPDAAVDRRALIQQDFGHCVMVANWQASVALLRSEVGTKDEDAAIAALVPALGPCVQAGTTVNLTKSAVRKALNEPFYHAVTDVRREAAK